MAKKRTTSDNQNIHQPLEMASVESQPDAATKLPMHAHSQRTNPIALIVENS
jgi:hypothetical protein